MDNLKDILKESEFHFSKKFGQNFITDTNLLNAIVSDAGITCDDTVLEIGAGGGTLTKALAKVARRVVSFEIDNNLQPVLAKTLSNNHNVEIYFKDILSLDIKDINAIMGGEYKLVANLPYYITTPIIFHFLENITPIVSLTVMVQKEVADRMCASASESSYGALTVSIKTVAEVTLTRTVNRALFYPVPNVDSAIVRMDIRKLEGIENRKILSETIKCAFLMRRKTLINNMTAYFKMSRVQSEEILLQMKLDYRIRGEALNIGQFVELANLLAARLK